MAILKLIKEIFMGLLPKDDEVEPVTKQNTDAKDNKADAITNALYAQTKLKIENDDPTILLILAIEDLLEKKADAIFANIEAETDNITTNMLEHQSNIDKAFESKLKNLTEVLEKLEGQKQAVVADVWKKMEERTNQKIQNMLESGMKEIAKNSNNQVNNQRILLIGGFVGTIFGFALCAIILYFFK